MRLTTLVLGAVALLAPVRPEARGCEEDIPATCLKLCRLKLNKPVLISEYLGITGSDEQLVCACYTERTIIVDDKKLSVEKE